MTAATAKLPGHEIVEPGIADLQEGRETVESLLVEMAAPRLRRAGVALPPCRTENPSHRLYALLSGEPDAHSRYNALTRRILKFASAAEFASPRR